MTKREEHEREQLEDRGFRALPALDVNYRYSDQKEERSVLRAAISMLKPECRPVPAFSLGDAPDCRAKFAHHHWLYTDAGAFDHGMLDALGRLCLTLGYRFRFLFSVVLEERGAEMVKNSTGVDAKAGGRLAVVICAPLGGRKLWYQKEAE